jgi:replication-associated recombination protein RarA
MGVALYEKWRPKKFEDVVAQDEAIRRIKNAGRDGFAGESFRLVGKSSSGKSTLAWIIAREVASDHNIWEFNGRDLTVSMLKELVLTQFCYKPLAKFGYALIVNESHGLQKPVIEYLLNLLEAIARGDFSVSIIFTTTLEGNDLFEDTQMDAGPFKSRTHFIPLAQRGVKPAFAELARKIAQAEGLDGQPIEAYMKLMESCHNNLREALQRIKQGEMLNA